MPSPNINAHAQAVPNCAFAYCVASHTPAVLHSPQRTRVLELEGTAQPPSTPFSCTQPLSWGVLSPKGATTTRCSTGLASATACETRNLSECQKAAPTAAHAAAITGGLESGQSAAQVGSFASSLTPVSADTTRSVCACGGRRLGAGQPEAVAGRMVGPSTAGAAGTVLVGSQHSPSHHKPTFLYRSTLTERAHPSPTSPLGPALVLLPQPSVKPSPFLASGTPPSPRVQGGRTQCPGHW